MQETQEKEEVETINKTKRLVVYPDQEIPVQSFLNKIQDSFDPWEETVREWEETTYRLHMGDVVVEIDETTYGRLDGQGGDDAYVSKDVEEMRKKRMKWGEGYIFESFVSNFIGELDWGSVTKKEGSNYWKDEDKNIVSSVRSSFKSAKMVKPYEDQEHDDVFEGDGKYEAFVVKFNCKDLPADLEGHMDKLISNVATELARQTHIMKARPVKCFEVEETKEICPRV